MDRGARTPHALVVLSVSQLAIGCTAQNEPDDDGAMSTSSMSGTDTQGTTEATAFESSTSMSATSDATGTQDATVESSGTAGPIDCSDVDFPEYEISPLCSDYAAHGEECGVGLLIVRACVERLADYCEGILNYSEGLFGPACRDAYEELIACLNGLDCRDLEEHEACSIERANERC